MKLLSKLDLLSLLALLSMTLVIIVLNIILVQQLFQGKQQQTLRQQLANLYTSVQVHYQRQLWVVGDAHLPSSLYHLQQRLQRQVQHQLSAETHFVMRRLQPPHSVLPLSKHFVQTLPEAVWQYLQQQQQGEFNFSLQGEDYLCLFVSLPEAGWLLALVVPQQAIVLPWRDYVYTVSLFMLAVIGIWILLHLHFNRLLFRRIDNTLSCVRSVAQGELDSRISVPDVQKGDEISRLQDGINRMAAALEQRQRDLELKNQQQAEAEIMLQNRLEELQQAQIAKQHSLQAVQREKAHLQALLCAMQRGILFEDIERKISYYNQAFLNIWQFPRQDDLSGQDIQTVMKEAGQRLVVYNNCRTLFMSIAEKSPDDLELELQGGRVITQNHYPVHDAEGSFIGCLWVYEDVTRERQTAAQLIYLAEHDALTGLYNRRYLQEELGKLIADVEPPAVAHALLFFDLDEFKYINDTYGHGVGDSVLTRCSHDMQNLLDADSIFARIGGDEFAILLRNSNAQQAGELAERIVHGISRIPFQFDNKVMRLTSSLGIAFYPTHAVEAETLLAHADAAMYQAKAAGKNTWRIYSPDKDTSAQMVEHFSWSKRVEHALENGLLRLFFQGVHHASNCELAHLEVLIRMQDVSNPDQLVTPDRFIPLAEKTGLILDIDLFVIEQSIELLARSKRIPPLAINLSGCSMEDHNLPYYIAKQLEKKGVDPKRLLIELTETTAVADLHDAQNFIDVVSRVGCPVCLDDFGVGFSSFAYLKHLNVDILKIDGMFIKGLVHDQDNQIFVKAIVDVARSMGKRTIAEFVEDEATLNMLRDMQVDYVQGYHLHKPQAYHPAFQGVPVATMKFPWMVPEQTVTA